MLKVFTSFSGYDSQCMALDRLGIDYDLVGWSEIDKYAIQAHNAVYPQYADRNYGDITKIDWGGWLILTCLLIRSHVLTSAMRASRRGSQRTAARVPRYCGSAKRLSAPSDPNTY